MSENNNINWYETDLTDSYWDRNKPYIKIKDGVTEIPDNCFDNCDNLKEIYIPNSVREIGEGCFGWCENLKEIQIPNSVRKIGKYCFIGCDNLKTLFIPAYLDYSRDYLGIPDTCELVEY